MAEYNANNATLEAGGKLIEQFCLRPNKYANQTAVVRLHINSKWGGWKLRDDLVERLGLEIGDTISTSVTPEYTEGLSNEVEDIDLFASGSGAEWLIMNKVTMGTIIDCEVSFSYVKVPIGINGKESYRASLIFEKGFAIIEHTSVCNKQENDEEDKIINDLLQRLVESE